MLPDAIVQALGLVEGATFVIEVEPSDPDVIRLRPIRRSYAGVLKGVSDPSAEFLAAERASWHPE